MSKNKSYMDKENILTEGFFKSFIRNFLILYGAKKLWDRRKKKKIEKQLGKDTPLKNKLNKLNKDVSDIEKHLSKAYGFKVDLDKYELSDFK